MNRIAGIFHTDGSPVNPDVLVYMLGKIKLGLDDPPRLVSEGCVGFASIFTGAKLNTKDYGTPFVHSNGQWMIAIDGRIDNYSDLYSALQSSFSQKLALVSDVEIILAAYEKWGLDFPAHLIGDFAVAIWDKANQRLICVRDHFGVKPLYYYYSKDTYVFASTPDAILASGEISPRIYEERIADHLVSPLEGVNKTNSFYMNIFRLPPGHMLIIQNNGMQIQRYWDLHPADLSGLKTEDDFVAAFNELLKDTVRCRLRDRTASMLSGGIDSSSIVGLGRKVLADDENRPLDVFAAISNYPDINRETPYINSVISQGNTQAFMISETELARHMDELVKAFENEGEPFDCLMNLNRSIYLTARTRGFYAMLDGVDGDVLLTRSEYLLQLWRELDFHNIIAETIKADGVMAEYKMGKSLLINSLISVFASFVPEWARRERHRIRYRRKGVNAVHETIISQEFAVRSRLKEQFAMLDLQSPRPSSLTQMEFHKIALEHSYLTVGLERYERVASQFGIEARHPLLDIRLANFSLGLPWNFKIRRGWTKYILRRAMEPYLPADVVWRKDKDSLMWEYNRLILKNKADYFHQTTLDEKQALKPYVDIQKLEKIWREYLTKGDERHADLIWSGIALAFWLRRHRNMVRDLKLEQ